MSMPLDQQLGGEGRVGVKEKSPLSFLEWGSVYRYIALFLDTFLYVAGNKYVVAPV